ncbi:MAG TPA: TSUP family transporter [Oligoflexia bacterium]|nr:TSUP family transporter [Oligoflexia bacterium]HMP49057.1 TSUP family transporter [Oligoflexia bacterium]
MSLSIIIACIGSFVAGVVDAIAGGGGVITMPVLIFLGYPVDMVLGTNKLISTSGTSFAATNFIRKNHYSDFVLKYNLIFTCIGAAIGASCASLVVEEVLKPIVSVLIIGIALYLFFKPDIGIQDKKLIYSRYRISATFAASFGIGFYDGIFGPGTGAFLTFMFLKVLGQNFLLANGNTKILNLASNVVSLAIFVYYQKIIWAIGIPMAFCNMLGGIIGSQIAIKRGTKWIRWIFIFMASLVGIRQLL